MKCVLPRLARTQTNHTGGTATPTSKLDECGRRRLKPERATKRARKSRRSWARLPPCKTARHIRTRHVTLLLRSSRKSAHGFSQQLHHRANEVGDRRPRHYAGPSRRVPLVGVGDDGAPWRRGAISWRPAGAVEHGRGSSSVVTCDRRVLRDVCLGWRVRSR